MTSRFAAELGDIVDFHKKFELGYDGPGRQLPPNLSKFRVGFQEEELEEYAEAVNTGDMARQLDALVDQMYVLLGTIYLHGWGPIFGEAWRRVHEKNMQKVRAKRLNPGTRDWTFDVVKPPGWEPADLGDLVADAREAAE